MTRNSSDELHDPDPCPTCGAGPSFQIPVWDEKEAAESGADPDYIGCTECRTMRVIGGENAHPEDCG